jgi:formyl-CoA transferase
MSIIPAQPSRYRWRIRRVRLSTIPGGIRTRAAALGEHTDEVLREIGYDENQIASLKAGEVV